MATILLMAGGTGGHLFPAMALAEELKRRGHEIHLATDERVTGYGDRFPAREVHVVRAATPSLRNPLKLARAAAVIGWGTIEAMRLIRKIRPDAAVGFGGYPTFPPALAASLLGVPTILHEANAVLGRANKALARFADVLALGFAETKYADGFRLEKVVTGNPVRDSVKAAAAIPYPRLSSEGAFKLLVFGGSQGARAFADLVPPAILALPAPDKARLMVTQQCRPEDLDRVAKAYAAAHVSVELQAFFDDLPQRMAEAHLVFCRSGASTVAELGVIGRPAIMVPLPGSIDADQKANATQVQAAGAGWLVDQATLSPQSLASRLDDLMRAPTALVAAAQAARALGQGDAVARLADVTERAAAGTRRANKGSDRK